MPYITTFIEVGRSKFCGEKKTEDMPTFDDLLSAIQGKLMSSEIDFQCNPDKLSELHDGITDQVTGIVVVGGFRPVGNFKIERAA